MPQEADVAGDHRSFEDRHPFPVGGSDDQAGRHQDRERDAEPSGEPDEQEDDAPHHQEADEHPATRGPEGLGAQGGVQHGVTRQRRPEAVQDYPGRAASSAATSSARRPSAGPCPSPPEESRLRPGPAGSQPEDKDAEGGPTGVLENSRESAQLGRGSTVGGRCQSRHHDDEDRLRHLLGAGAGVWRLRGDRAARPATGADLRRRCVPRARRPRRRGTGPAAAARAADDGPRGRVGMSALTHGTDGPGVADVTCATPVHGRPGDGSRTHQLKFGRSARAALVCGAQVLVEVDHQGPRGRRAESGPTQQDQGWPGAGEPTHLG